MLSYNNLIHYLFLFCSVVLFFYAPLEYSYAYCLAISIVFIVQAFLFSIRANISYYINFYTLFLLSFSLVNFIYPVLIYPINPEMFSVFTLSFNESFITKGTALAQVAASSLMVGGISKKAKNKFSEITEINYYGINRTLVLVLSCFVMYLLTVGTEFLGGNFAGQTNLSNYILILLENFIVIASILFFTSQKSKKNKIYWLTVAAYLFLFLSIGDRGPALRLIVLIIGLYYIFVKKISVKYLVMLGVAGVILFEVIGQGRVHYSNAKGNILSRGLEKVEEEDYRSLTRSFVINARNLYVGMDYIDRNEYNWGRTSFLPSIISVVPFGQTLYKNVAETDLQSSSDFFTELQFGKDPPYGLGTNLVADVYISFGFFGVLIAFFIFGRMIELFRQNALFSGSVIAVIIYFILLSESIIYPRATLLGPLNNIVWTIFMFIILKKFRIIGKLSYS